MIDTSVETVIPLGKVGDEVPSRQAGKKLSTSTVWRWAIYGCRGVKLETCLIGTTRYTSREAIQRFSEELSRGRNGEGKTPVAPSVTAATGPTGTVRPGGSRRGGPGSPGVGGR